MATPTSTVPLLMAVSDPQARHRAGLDFESWIELLVSCDVDTVQIREKSAAGSPCSPTVLFETTKNAVDRSGGHLKVVVNGRADIAVAAAAHGVHLPSSGLPTEALRRRFPGLIIGRSTHEAEEAVRAVADGADYVTFGPVFATPSKAGFGPPKGLAAAASLKARGLPVVALGGVGADEARRLAAHGLGCAAIRAVHDPETCRALAEAVRGAGAGIDDGGRS